MSSGSLWLERWTMAAPGVLDLVLAPPRWFGRRASRLGRSRGSERHAQQVERELKFELSEPVELERLGGCALEPRVFSSFYYDTAELRLMRHDQTLRRRLEKLPDARRRMNTRSRRTYDG